MSTTSNATRSPRGRHHTFPPPPHFSTTTTLFHHHYLPTTLRPTGCCIMVLTTQGRLAGPVSPSRFMACTVNWYDCPGTRSSTVHFVLWVGAPGDEKRRKEGRRRERKATTTKQQRPSNNDQATTRKQPSQSPLLQTPLQTPLPPPFPLAVPVTRVNTGGCTSDTHLFSTNLVPVETAAPESDVFTSTSPSNLEGDTEETRPKKQTISPHIHRNTTTTTPPPPHHHHTSHHHLPLSHLPSPSWLLRMFFCVLVRTWRKK
jgi:hypothetical protein